MIEINYLKEKERKAITEFLQWNDRNGCYTDENSDIEGVERISYQDAVKYFFGVINSELYYAITDNIFELTYEEVIDYSRRFNVYETTMHKLVMLFKQKSVNPKLKLYRSLVD
jgi:hypothetical protein